MKKYLRALYESFGQIRLYYDVIHQWVGSGLTYLFILACLISTIMVIQFAVIMYGFKQTELPHLLKQWPVITIAKGQISTEVEQPHTIRSIDGTAIITIDTKLNEAELGKQDSVLLVGKDFILSKRSDGSFKKTDLNSFKQKDMVIDRARVASFFETLKFLPLLLLPFLAGGQWLIFIAMAVAAASLSYVVTAYMPEEYDFETRMRIAVIAITPPILINHALQLLTTYSLGFWITLVLWVVHLYAIIIGARFYKNKIEIIA